ncbi:hypothetical protein QL285_009795 [Trifolium repens]|nr:hypothetical protein QL285_009795 [Trifolium repens]
MQQLFASEATYQKLEHQTLRLKTSDSDMNSESRFVRRTFSATMIRYHHHPLTSQKLENQSYPQNSDVSTIVRTLYRIWLKRYPQDCSYSRLPDLVKEWYYIQLA